ncbi:hypothetical protein ASPCADRAFT_212392 [Aspergillus carbonarius ITEM 5010]|uniref:Uncharacterized protein n=1 Tax=Aspergillus carbonarius (strain ITEM 5010) TaxID=602072 RepID=A0A1R3R606_ASPC5|nr:hypothetical protein ASPCADRAFT_212392 [Aspergillus carbonarius ITEM 5010]
MGKFARRRSHRPEKFSSRGLPAGGLIYSLDPITGPLPHRWTPFRTATIMVTELLRDSQP